MINENLWYAYTQVTLVFPTRSIEGNFAIITAWNPRSVCLSEDENRRNNRRLQQALIGYDLTDVIVGNDDFSWYEESFAVVMPLADAVVLAGQFAQNALYYVQDGQVILQSCLDHQRFNLGLLSSKITSP
ncbi:DUF3293 domain-containing protein [Vibrio metschnikovii]|uniref:DUF3293 domain-containing protein n=1 Tax=Vibrio metschnikovii TaxID=28172 RepID=UPI0016495908|nr:DUF3293 domain-containing protein [Vibrio metschnikovii]MBC3616746.1 DUF3293 domain-containing protein [Vibrio metschnikovii]MBC5812680.1 DUF3293 domain-containing protein [Vibrio metschnikovii]